MSRNVILYVYFIFYFPSLLTCLTCCYETGVEVSQSVGGICEVLPEDKASVVQRAAAAAARAAHQRV